MSKIFPDCSKPRFAWPGGYPLAYLITSRTRFRTFEDVVLCAACTAEAERSKSVDGWKEFVSAQEFVHWEGEPIQCDGCSEDIESAYGPIEEDSANEI